ncbi:hypothetical protein LTR08_001267 [Meristemomyces frigidus]|nr:hypothetical protein LTR08_001267 [Meristemomyces frigidus]
MAATATVWGTVALFLIAIKDGTARSWGYKLEDSESTFVRWSAIEGIGLFLELFLFGFAVVLFCGLQMSAKSKVTVVLGFGLRLPIIAFAIIRLINLREHLPLNQFSYDYALPEVYIQAEMHFNLVAATIPCLRIFLKGCTTGWLGEQLQNRQDTAMATKSARIYGALSSMASSKKKPDEHNSEEIELQRWQHSRTKAPTTQDEVAMDDDERDASARCIVVRQSAVGAYTKEWADETQCRASSLG